MVSEVPTLRGLPLTAPLRPQRVVHLSAVFGKEIFGRMVFGTNGPGGVPSWMHSEHLDGQSPFSP
jgi:hypothetical protein